MNLLKELVRDTLLRTTGGEIWEDYETKQEKKELSTEISEKKLETKEVPKQGRYLGKQETVTQPEVEGFIFEKEEILKAPVVEQVIKPREIIEIQPVITREREQTEVHEVVQPLHQREILPAVVEEKQLPAVEGEIVESSENFEKEYNETTQKFKSSVTVEDLKKERVEKKPIVQEVFHKKVIEEIQPVVHKETVVPHVIRETLPIRERIIEAPKLYQEEFADRPNWSEQLTESGEAIDVESTTKAPIFDEVILPKEIIEVQPVITREREQTEVHEVIKPIREQEILPAVIETKELPPITKETVVESGELFEKEYLESQQQFKSNVEVEKVEEQRILRKPIVQEIIHKKVIEEIQPVIHKETVVPHVVKEFLPIHEKIVEAPKFFREELEERDLGTVIIGQTALSPELETKRLA
jgi:hypothetical protein